MPELTYERGMWARKAAMFDNGNMTRVMTVPGTLAGRRQEQGRSAWYQILIAMLIVFGGFGSHAVFAQSISCSRTVAATPINMTPSITVPRDAANGTLLTPWLLTNQVQNYYTCTTSGSAPGSGMAFEPLSLTSTGTSVKSPDGTTTFTVWQTNLPGVGIAIGVRVFANGCNWQPWTNLGGATGALVPKPWVFGGCNAGNPSNGGQVEVALVKTGAITPGTFSGGALLEGALATSSSAGAWAISTAVGHVSFTLTQTTVAVAGCTTQDVTVTMNSHQQSEFKGVGSATTPATSFNIAVNACPSGLAKIQYQFIPVNAVLDATNGVLALSDSSTATGIGVQLKDDGGNALKYNTPYTLSGYNTATGGSYNIPLTAAYYQTAPTVTPGSANAVLTFTMSYQ
jgi:major type 1 subunit fimbrin (pilin)